MEKNPNKQVDRDKWVNDLMSHWGHLSDVANRSSIPDVNDKKEYSSLFLPMQRVFAKTIGLDLVEVKPMSEPLGILHFMDTVTYTDEEQIEMDPVKWMRANIEWIEIRTK